MRLGQKKECLNIRFLWQSRQDPGNHYEYETGWR